METNENTFDVNQFGVIARSKKKTYGMLTITGRCYLPPVNQTNVDYISDILSGDKYVSINRSNGTGIEI